MFSNLPDGDETDDAECFIGGEGEGFEGWVLAEKFGKAAGCGGVRGGKIGGEGLVGGYSVDEPFEGETVVELKDLAEALGELFVAHGGGVGDVDATVGEPAFHASCTGSEDGFAAGKCGAGDGVVEGWIEISQTGTEAEAVAQGAGIGGPRFDEVGGGGGASEGGRGGAFFVDADLATDFVDAPGADFGDSEGGEKGRGDGEHEQGGVAPGHGVGVGKAAADGGGGGFGVVENAGEGGFHGGELLEKHINMQVYS